MRCCLWESAPGSRSAGLLLTVTCRGGAADRAVVSGPGAESPVENLPAEEPPGLHQQPHEDGPVQGGESTHLVVAWLLIYFHYYYHYNYYYYYNNYGYYHIILLLIIIMVIIIFIIITNYYYLILIIMLVIVIMNIK